jgi:hypothetical protein
MHGIPRMLKSGEIEFRFFPTGTWTTCGGSVDAEAQREDQMYAPTPTFPEMALLREKAHHTATQRTARSA